MINLKDSTNQWDDQVMLGFESLSTFRDKNIAGLKGYMIRILNREDASIPDSEQAGLA